MICSSVNRLGFMSIPFPGDGLYPFLEEFSGLRSPTAPRSTSAFIARSVAMGVALSNLAAGHRHDGLGQARNPGRVASQGISALLALAITPSRPAQDRHGNS